MTSITPSAKKKKKKDFHFVADQTRTSKHSQIVFHIPLFLNTLFEK